MVFNSIDFLVFFALFFYLFWWVNNKFPVTGRNVFLIAASYVFYGWWDWRFLFLIIISSLSDFILGLRIYHSSDPIYRRIYLMASLIINLGILGFFKYFNFFIESFRLLLDEFGMTFNTQTLNIILPVGISFYTFQTLSYSIDIYRGELQPTRKWAQFFAFVAFFPQLVAGPIERAKRFLPQFANRKIFNLHQANEGLRLIIWGFFKKIVIADNCALFVDEIFGNPSGYPGLGILVGALAFAFQIYCDFSGYSDIAIGLGKVMGFELMTNFRKPYFASSFREFWQRWHISLSTWFRDYVYIPLGGKRVGVMRNNFNLLFTFVISGLWHGANFTFLIWGFIHGLALVIEKRIKILKSIGWPLVFLITSLFWLPFRANDVGHLGELVTQLGHLNDSANWEGLSLMPPAKFAAWGMVFLIFMIVEWFSKNQNFSMFMDRRNSLVRIGGYSILVAAILLLGNFDVKPSFIYFQF